MLTPGSTLNLAAPCLPPGISEEFFFWPIVAFRQVTLRTDDGEEVDAVWVVYKREERAIAVVWAAERLVAVDPSPETDDPDWIDSAFVITDEDGRVERDMYLFQVKTPGESKYPYDYYKQLATIPAAEAFRPLSESACPLVKKG